MYKYRVYGLNVHSNRKLDCYPHSFDAADIIIEFTDSEDEARRYIGQLVFDGEPREISAPEGIGKFYFCGEKHIVVYYQNEDAIDRFLVHALLGFGFSCILMQRKVFLIHGSSVMLDGSTIIIVGGSEAGKSSLAAALVQKGGRLISDDTTRLEMDTEAPFVYPSYPLRRIYKNTLEYLGIGMEDAFEIITKKGKFALSDSSQKVFLNSESPVKAIVRITPVDTDEVLLIREEIRNAILIVCRNVFNYKIIKHSEFAGEYLDFVLNVCDRIPVYSLRRPKNALTVREQADAIIKEFYTKDAL